MNFLQQIFSEHFIYALGWTLLHSLWQGALIGLIVAVAMILLHKFTAKLRYFINSISLFVLAGLAVITFLTSYSTYQPDPAMSVNKSTTGLYVNYDQAAPSQISPAGEGVSMQYIIDTTAAYCHEHIPLFVMIWLFGMFAMMLRFLGGYALVRRYRSHRVKAVIGDWEQKFQDLARRIQVNKNVRLLESALVRVPVAIGYLKPVVLLPLGALNGVPAQQMEAILVHELAHIRRRDYLMNMIQSLLEVIFFYHPVVWWLSKNIRIERENICDDIAITITGNTMEFAKALTNIQEINLGSPALAAGLSGKNKHRLVNRIRRLAGKPKVQSGFAEGFIAASMLLISLIGLSAAAMITYPTELPEVHFSFDASPADLPWITYDPEPVVLPDTTEKQKQKQKQLQWEQQAQQEKAKQERAVAIEAQVQAQLEAVEEHMKAVRAEMEQHESIEVYEQAMQEINSNREAYVKQMQEAVEAYEEAMRDADLDMNVHGAWTLPHIYFNHGKEFYFGGDSTVWTQDYPTNIFFHGDSLSDLYFDHMSDKYENYQDLMILKEDQFMELQDQLMELQEVYVPMPDLPDYNYNLHFSSNFGVPGSAKGIVTQELYEDDLIDHGRQYIVLIGKKQMLINGEKQSKTVFKKYRRILDSIQESWQFDDDEEFRIHIGY